MVTTKQYGKKFYVNHRLKYLTKSDFQQKDCKNIQAMVVLHSSDYRIVGNICIIAAYINGNQ